jgi:hypothetical protein
MKPATRARERMACPLKTADRSRSMSINPLERRQDRRTQAYVPITMRSEGGGDETPAHLIDLSAGGAGILTTSSNAPFVGQHLELLFEVPTNNEDADSRMRRESAIVVNLRQPERGVTRVGLRFIQNHGFGASLFDPILTLSDHRRHQPKPKADTSFDPWKTARNFERHNPMTTAGAV